MDETPETSEETEATPEASAELTEESIPLADFLELKENARKWEARSKENLKELEKLRASQPEASKLEERLAALEAENLNLKVEAISNAYSIPTEFRDRLKGSTPEEIEADAKALSEILNGVPALQKTDQETGKKLVLPQGSVTTSPTMKISSKEEMLKARKTN